MKNYPYILGLDLGQQNDYTVLSMLKMYEIKGTLEYHLQYLKKYPLRTSYPDIVELVNGFIKNPFLKDKALLIVDYTGVGRPVVDLLRGYEVNLVALNITGGSSSNWKNNREVSVPKKDIVSSLQVSFQSSKLKISSDIKHLDDLKKEFINFKAKINSGGNASFNAASGYHDDIVMSIGIAIWYVEYVNRKGRTLRIITGG